MPLSKGCTTKTRNENVKKLIEEGFPAQQAYAIAMSTQQKACGMVFFNYGLLGQRDLLRIVGDAEVRPADGQGHALGFFGTTRKPGLVRRKSEVVAGYTVPVSADDLEAIHQKLGGSRAYKLRSVTVKSKGRAPYPAQTFVPVAKREVAGTDASYRKVATAVFSVIGHEF